MANIEIKVPDIGDYTDVPVIEILVAVGDTVAKDQGLVTLESDKATMEVPSAFAGVVKEIKVKLGDEIAEGAVVALIEVSEGAADAKPAAAPAPTATAETGAKVEPVAVSPTPDKIAQREIAQERAAPAVAPAASRVLDDKPGIDPEASPPRTPPVEFNADRVLPEKVAYASPAVRLFARELGVDLNQVSGSERGGTSARKTCRSTSRARWQVAWPHRPPRERRPPPVAGSTCCRGRRWTSASSARSKSSRCRASRRFPAPTWPATGQ